MPGHLRIQAPWSWMHSQESKRKPKPKPPKPKEKTPMAFEPKGKHMACEKLCTFGTSKKKQKNLRSSGRTSAPPGRTSAARRAWLDRIGRWALENHEKPRKKPSIFLFFWVVFLFFQFFFVCKARKLWAVVLTRSLYGLEAKQTKQKPKKPRASDGKKNSKELQFSFFILNKFFFFFLIRII